MQPAPQPSQPGETGGVATPGTAGGTGTTTSTPGETEQSEIGSTAAVKKQFNGTIALDPVKAKMDFATIMDEVVQQFTAKLGVDVTISVESEPRSRDGFDEALQRTVKENCNLLRFSNAEFEEE